MHPSHVCVFSPSAGSGSLAVSAPAGFTPPPRLPLPGGLFLGCHHSRPLKRPSGAQQWSQAVDILKTFKIIPEMSSVFSKITSSKGKRGQQAEPLLERVGDAEGSCSEGEGAIAQECNHAFGAEGLS